jgi:hypothetical protein
MNPEDTQQPQLITDKRKITSKINARKAGEAKLAKRKALKEMEQYSVYEDDGYDSEQDYSEYSEEESEVEEYIFKPLKKEPKVKPLKGTKPKAPTMSYERNPPTNKYEQDVVNRKIDKLASIVERLVVSNKKKVRKPYSTPKPTRNTVVQILPSNNSAPSHNPVKEAIFKSMIEL